MDFVRRLALIKLSDLGISAGLARESGVSHPTALHAFDCMRYSILCELAKTDKMLKGEIEADKAYFGGKRKGNSRRWARNKAIVCGILERKGKVSVDMISNVSANTLLASTKEGQEGNMVHTDRWHGYDSLMFSGYKHMSVDHQKRFANDKVYLNGIEGFWSFAKERMAKYHGINPNKFLLYIKEMEWRYNNRNTDTFSLLIDYVLGDK